MAARQARLAWRRPSASAARRRDQPAPLARGGGGEPHVPRRPHRRPRGRDPCLRTLPRAALGSGTVAEARSGPRARRAGEARGRTETLTLEEGHDAQEDRRRPAAGLAFLLLVPAGV